MKYQLSSNGPEICKLSEKFSVFNVYVDIKSFDFGFLIEISILNGRYLATV